MKQQLCLDHDVQKNLLCSVSVTLKTCNEEDDVSDEERIYMNVETLNTYGNFTKQPEGAEEEETEEKEIKIPSIEVILV